MLDIQHSSFNFIKSLPYVILLKSPYISLPSCYFNMWKPPLSIPLYGVYYVYQPQAISQLSRRLQWHIIHPLYHHCHFQSLQLCQVIFHCIGLTTIEYNTPGMFRKVYLLRTLKTLNFFQPQCFLRNFPIPNLVARILQQCHHTGTS